MPAYTPTVWTNGATACNQTNMNHIEQQLGKVQYSMTMLTTPPLLANNVALNAGTTNTYTCTGIGTPVIPSGIIAVFLHVQQTTATAGAQTTFVPHGTTWVAGQYPSLASPAISQPVTGSFWCAVDASGQIDVKGNVQNVTGLFIGIGAYLY